MHLWYEDEKRKRRWTEGKTQDWRGLLLFDCKRGEKKGGKQRKESNEWRPKREKVGEGLRRKGIKGLHLLDISILHYFCYHNINHTGQLLGFQIRRTDLKYMHDLRDENTLLLLRYFSLERKKKEMYLLMLAIFTF